ncbi:hypothetical protein PMAYCL1PPCAC_13883, partial [Pristionchus mayeri]
CGCICDQLSRVVGEHANRVIAQRVRNSELAVYDPLGDPVDGHRLGRLADIVRDLVPLHVARFEQRSELCKKFREMAV